MELVYSVDTQQKHYVKDWISEERICASLSCRNVLALCKLSENVDSCQFDQQYEIVAFDLDKPWEPHRVTMATSQLVHMEWDTTGSKLLVVTVLGECQVWTMKEHLLNRWSCVGKVSIGGEEVLSVVWFHNSLQVLFDPDKREKTQYIEKFVRNPRFSPPLTQFGGSQVEGWILVTASGLVSVSVCLANNDIVTVSESLSPSHMRLTSADIANTGNGDVMIAVSDGQLSSAIQCYLISLHLQARNISITCKNSASLYMKTQMEYGGNENQTMRITKVMFMNHDCSDTVFVCCGSPSYSCLEVWQLLEQMMPLHKMFSMNTAPDTSNKTHKWMHKATIPHPSLLTSIAGPRLPMSRNVVETTGFMPFISVAYKDGSVQLVHRYTFQVISTSNVDSLCQQVQPVVHTGDKKQKLQAAQLSMLAQTNSGCGIVGLHDGQVYLFRTYNSSRDSTMQLSPASIVLLLEYAMVTGLDWWDVFLAIRQGMIMNVCQSMTDNFSKQVVCMQDYVFMRLLSIKMGLFSSYSVSVYCFSAGHQKAGDYHARLVLHSVGNVIKGTLKPRTISSQDKSPSEKVTFLCNKHTDGDIDNILASLDADEFHIDMRKKDRTDNSLHSLQPLIQWVSDFCLQLLSSAPLFQSLSSFPGSTILNDITELSMLRELLVIFKMWGLIYPPCLPSFTTMSVNLDIIKHLYKLITRAWSYCKDGRNIEFDDSLQDECSLLPSKVLIPSANQCFRMDGKGFSVFTQPLPLMFKFDEEPDYLHQKKYEKSYRSSVDSSVTNQQQHDIVRQISLGTKVSEETRQCSRCGCQSLLDSHTKSQIMMSWEQRWARNCLCMGHWKLVK